VVDIDFGEDDPIVGGAAGDGSDDAPPPDSPASRARALHPVTPPPIRILPGEQLEQKPTKRKVLRGLIITLIVLIVLGGGAFATRYWVLSQYYVGEASNTEIAIFQGVRGSVLGISLNRQVQGSCVPGQACEEIKLDDLNQSARLNVEAGIPATSLADAEATLQRLRTQQVLPACQPTSTTPTAPTSTTVPPPGSGTPTTTNTVAPTTTNGASNGIGSTVGSSASVPTTSSVVPSHQQQPGSDCRKPGS
jgi:protein phosphatase